MDTVTTNPPQRRRRRWIVRPRYQFFFALVLVLFQVDVGLIYLGAMQQYARRVAENARDLDAFLKVDLWTNGLPMVLGLSLAMGLVVYLMGLRFSHQIVGPLPRLSAALQAMAQGDYSQRLTFRPGDAIGELADDVNRLAESLAQRAGAPHASVVTAPAAQTSTRPQPVVADETPVSVR